MELLNLTTQKSYSEFEDSLYNKNNSYLILCAPYELSKIQKSLDIDEITFRDCLDFDEHIKLDLFDNYDFLSLNTFELINNKAIVKEVNIYLSDNFMLVVVDKEHFIHEYVQKLIYCKFIISKSTNVSLFKINYLIFKEIIIHGFETLEKVEDMILSIEDRMLADTTKKHIAEISYVRGITRTIVKNTRPLLYIGDRILKENIRYLKYSDIKKYNLENLQGIDFNIDRLYNFALSTRELADKLLDIYSSRIGEKTNSLISKLTVLTAIAAPLTIITGIYGMNFKYMPELNFVYGYPLTLGIMISIVIIGVVILKNKNVF